MLSRVLLLTLAVSVASARTSSAQVTAGREQLGQICGIKFNDVNGNGVRDTGEAAMPGWTITISGGASGTRVTDERGGYCWNELKAGRYTVTEVNQPGWTQTAPSGGSYVLTLAPGQFILNRDFGNRRGGGGDDKLGRICGVKFNDVNGNGQRDPGEQTIPGWQIQIGGGMDATTTTDRQGNYCFGPLKAGEYKVSEVQQAGWTQTAPRDGYYVVTLATGQRIANFDFGNRRGGDDKPGRICGIKFNDANGNGVRDPGESTLSGWQITLDGVGTGTTLTDREGNYCFGPLKPGDYKVGEVQQPGWTQTAPSGGYYSFNLAAGQSITGRDFGNRRGGGGGDPSKICGIKFNDVNGNGVRDSGEPTLAGWTITLDGVASATTVTDAQGNYCFSPLKAGDYLIKEVQQPGWTQTRPAAGSYQLNLTAGQSVSGYDFGNRRGGGDPGSCPNGYAWSPLGSGVSGEVWALARIGNDLYVGGNFTSAGGAPANYVAKWNGSSWSSLGSGSANGLGGPVFSMAVVGSDLYVGGYFNTAGGNAASNVAKWNGTSWSPLGAGLNSPGAIEAMAVMGNKLYVGAPWVVTSGTMTANSLAAWDLTTSTWSAVGTGMNNRVNSLTVIGNTLYAGGEFTTAGGLPANYIASWNGTTFAPLGSGMNSRVGGGMGVHNGDLYPGGTFVTAGGVTVNHVARWNAGNGTFSALGSGINNGVEGFASMGGSLYVSGDFNAAGGVSANFVAKWDGSAWSALGAGMNNSVWRLLPIGNTLYAGGVFTQADNQPASRVAKWACK